MLETDSWKWGEGGPGGDDTVHKWGEEWKVMMCLSIFFIGVSIANQSTILYRKYQYIYLFFNRGRSNLLCSLRLQGRTRRWRKTNGVVWADFSPVDKSSECMVRFYRKKMTNQKVHWYQYRNIEPRKYQLFYGIWKTSSSPSLPTDWVCFLDIGPHGDLFARLN